MIINGDKDNGVCNVPNDTDHSKIGKERLRGVNYFGFGITILANTDSTSKLFSSQSIFWHHR